MSLAVFFFEGSADASVGSSVSLGDAEAHHAATSKRVRAGEEVVLTDGRGVALISRVTHVSRHEVRLLVERLERSEPPALQVTVVQAVAKGDRGERAVELLTEVGVSRIVPWQAQRSVSRWDAKAERGRAKWQSTAEAAAKQSRRQWWPDVAELADLSAVTGLVAGADRAFVLHEGAHVGLADLMAAATLPASGEVVLVVGPEGGITDDELSALEAAGAATVRLGPTVLRTSTAGVVAATLVLATTPLWRESTSEGADHE